MTMTVKGPNGLVVNFPDGTDQQTIDRGMREAMAAKVKSEPVHRGNILPIDRDSAGGLSFNINSGLPGALIRGMTAVEDAYQGRTPMWEIDPATGRGRTSGAAISRAAEAAAVVSPVNPGIRAGDMAIPGTATNIRPQRVTPPTGQELVEAGAAGRKAIRGMGVDYDPRAVVNTVLKLRHELAKEGLNPRSAKETFAVLDELSKVPALDPSKGDIRSVAQLDTLAQALSELGHIAKNNPGMAEAVAANASKRALGSFIEAADPASVMAGAALVAGRALKESNANYAAGKRSTKLTRDIESAELRAAVANSGANIDNSIRAKAGWIMDPHHPERRSGFSPEEQAAIAEVANGTWTRNRIRGTGNKLGGGGGIGTTAVASAAGYAGGVFGPVGGVALGIGVPALGIAAKKTGNALTKRAMQGADELVRQRSPLYERMKQEAPAVAPADLEQLRRAAAIRALLLQGNEVY